MNPYKICLGTILAFAVGAGIAEAMQYVVTGADATQCTFIDEYSGGHWNWGGAIFANTMPIDYGFRENMLLRFDLPPLLDPALIQSATLTLHRNDWLSSEGILRLYRLKESWSEGTGAPAVGGEMGMVDWFDRFHGGLAWSVPGAVGGGSSLNDPTVIRTVNGEYTISMNIMQDVMWWYQNGGNAQNFGWVMTDEDSDHTWRYGIRFDSDDFDPQTFPTLTVTVVPEPSTLAIFVGVGAISLLAYAWRRWRLPK